MNCRKRRFICVVVLCSVVSLFAQNQQQSTGKGIVTGSGGAERLRDGDSEAGVISYDRVLPTFDTIRFFYRPTKWSVIPQVEYGKDIHTGTIFLPRPDFGITQPLLTFKPAAGDRVTLGLIGEFQLPRTQWDMQLAFRYGWYAVQLESRERMEQVYYVSRVRGNVAEIEARAAVQPWTFLPLQFFFGMLGEYHVQSEVAISPVYDTTAVIENRWIVPTHPNRWRFGGKVGIQYSWFLMDIVPRFRVYMLPQLLIMLATPYSTEHQSRWWIHSVRLSVAFRFNFLKSEQQRIPYRRPIEPIGPVLAAVNPQIEATIPPLSVVALTPAPVEEAIIQAQVAAAEEIEGIGQQQPPSIDAVQQQKIVTPPIEPNRIQRFFYPTSLATALTPELQQWLNELAEYLRTHPNAQVRIVGHTDNFGTAPETQRVSEQRANEIRQYLIRRGIDPSRIFASGQGARFPIADNRTEEGRRMNRRVEILIVE